MTLIVEIIVIIMRLINKYPILRYKFLKIYCNLVDNKEDNEFLTNIFIKNNISDQVTYENRNDYKGKKYLIRVLTILKYVLKTKIMKM